MPTIVFHDCSVHLHSRATTPDAHGAMLMSFWAEDPDEVNRDPALLVPIDELRSVSAYEAGTIALASVQYDDERLELALTGGAVRGVVRIARDHWQRARLDARVRWPLRNDGRDYEYMEVLVIPDPETAPPGATRVRYRGFHARVVGVDAGQVELQLWHGGTSRITSLPQVTRVVPLADFDPLAQLFYPRDALALTTLDPADPAHHEGALFVAEPGYTLWPLSIPKLPPSHQR